tara:strand:+ start:30764 stop:31501 length:738 start_codon:yes stop_codon:yes gene_type:complete
MSSYNSNMSNPLISVIIPSYNRYSYLINAVESVFNQDYNNFEIIVVNDGSDQKEYYEQSFPSNVKQIDINPSLKNIHGFPTDAVRNKGVEIANGKYLAFLDDDDIWMEEKLSLQVELLENNKFKFSSTEGYFGEGVFNSESKYSLYNSEKFYKKIKNRYKRTDYYKKFGFPEIWDFEFISIHNCIITSSVMVEKDLFTNIGGFRGLPNGVGDYDCWLSLLKITDLIYLDKPLFYYDGSHGDGRNY